MKHPKSFIIWLISLFLAESGLLISLYSAYSHYKNYTDPLYSSFCAISESVNCDTVAQSPWSIIFDIPVAWWGVLFFVFFQVILLTEGYRNLRAWQGFFRLAVIASLVTLVLAGISAWKINSLCIVCLATYAITFALTYTCWLGKRQAAQEQSQAPALSTMLRNYALASSSFVVGLVLLFLFLPQYWNLTFEHADISSLSHGITEDHHPWIGAEEPLLTITEYSDYQCFQCYKMHFFLRQVLVEHPNSLRLVHRNYPLDHTVNAQVVPEPFHIGSGHLAKIAILGALRDKFWETNDLLYSIVRSRSSSGDTLEIPLQKIADKTGLDVNELAAALDHPLTTELLRRDIWDGMKLGILGTPAFEIEGEIYMGTLPPHILRRIAELPR